jgi:hypothetical protein
MVKLIIFILVKVSYLGTVLHLASFTLEGVIRLVEAFMWSTPLFGIDFKAYMYYITILERMAHFPKAHLLGLVEHQYGSCYGRIFYWFINECTYLCTLL